MPILSSRISARSIAGTFAVAVCLVVSAGRLTAAPRPAGPSSQDVLGTPTRVETALDATGNASALARAGNTRDALGFPVGVQRIGKHVRDGFESVEYDEVSEIDSVGKVTSLTQFDAKGRLRAAIRLDGAPTGGSSVSRETATAMAKRSAAATGLTAGATSVAEVDQATGGWTVRWARVEGGVPVRGDETRVRVWPNGRIQSVSNVGHELATAPSVTLAPETARRIASANMTRWFANRSSGYAIQTVNLEWVEPNGAFDPSRITAAPQPYRLAWVTDVKPTGAAADYMWLISLFVDAGDGNIIGGDFVE
jgi:hypothetical protein